MIVPKKLGPRIHIHKDMIFLYDPFWLEREDGTYLIDWAEREDVDKIKKYLKGKENPAAVFQLFSFPVHRVGHYRGFPCTQAYRSGSREVGFGTEHISSEWLNDCPPYGRSYDRRQVSIPDIIMLCRRLCHAVDRPPILLGKTKTDDQDTTPDAR
jgi:hypothetical protein